MYDFDEIHKKIILQANGMYDLLLRSDCEYSYNIIDNSNYLSDIYDIQEFLKKLKIVGFKHGEFSYWQYIKNCNIMSNNYYYIIFINIHGDTFGHVFSQYSTSALDALVGNSKLTFNRSGADKILDILKKTEYIKKTRIIPPDIMNDILNDKIFIEMSSYIIKNKFATASALELLYLKKIGKKADAKLDLFDVCYLKSMEQGFNPYDIHNSTGSYHYMTYTTYKQESPGATEKILNGKFLNIYDDVFINNQDRKKEIELEYERKLEKIKKMDANISVEIKNNTLYINNYYKKELNLADYIPLQKTKQLRNGKIVDFNRIDIVEIHIINSNMQQIKMLYKTDDEPIPVYAKFNKFMLYNCKKFTDLDKFLSKKIIEFYIDDVKISKIN